MVWRQSSQPNLVFSTTREGKLYKVVGIKLKKETSGITRGWQYKRLKFNLENRGIGLKCKHSWYAPF